MGVFYVASTVMDGNMKSTDKNYASVLPARSHFLKSHNIDPHDTTLVQVSYETENFCRYKTLNSIEKGDGITRQATIASDALVVTEVGHALFLPLADCIGAVIYSESKCIAMVSHLGRHSLEQNGGIKSIEYLVHHHELDPTELSVWLSPAAGKDHYPLYAFNNRSLHDVAREQFIAAGIPSYQLLVSPVDSAADPHYFSHSRFLKGQQETDGRHAIVAVIR